MHVESVPVASLVLDPANARKHAPKNLEAIKGSLVAFGQQKPIVVTPKGVVLAGNGTLEAARALGWDKIDVVRTQLDGTDATAYAIADNRTGELAEWDAGALSETLKSLAELDFDLGSIGFDEADLANLIATPEPPEGLTDPDDLPDDVEPRTKPGDLWVLGEHRLLCGDSTDVQHVERLMGGAKADMVYTDPPYGIGHDGRMGVDGATAANVYRPIANDDSVSAATDALALCRSLASTLIFWGANYYASALDDGSAWIVWDKQTVGDRFADCELAWVSKPGRVRRFAHQWHGMIKASERGEARVHPTQKPVALAEWCFTEYDASGKTVLDLFLGSGSTLIACEKTGRRCFGMEIDPHYCDVIVARWEAFTGKTAQLQSLEDAHGS